MVQKNYVSTNFDCKFDRIDSTENKTRLKGATKFELFKMWVEILQKQNLNLKRIFVESWMKLINSINYYIFLQY